MPNPVPVWREVFLEIALRALKKVHLSHTPWSLKKSPVKHNELKRLNNSPAVFHALETTVASEISNEFIYSSYTNGMNIIAAKHDEAQDEPEPQSRYFEIHREINLSSSDNKQTFFDDNGGQTQKSKSVDLIVRRICFRDGNPYYCFQSSLVELKRFYKTEIDISSGITEFQRYKRTEEPKTNFDDIVRDIKNLICLKKYWLTETNGIHNIKNNTNSADFILPPTIPPFLYVLTWGFRISDDEDIREKLKNQLDKHFIIPKCDEMYIKWMPISVVEKDKKPTVEEWLWLALIEVTNYQIK